MSDEALCEFTEFVYFRVFSQPLHAVNAGTAVLQTAPSPYRINFAIILVWADELGVNRQDGSINQEAGFTQMNWVSTYIIEVCRLYTDELGVYVLRFYRKRGFLVPPRPPRYRINFAKILVCAYELGL